MAKTHHSYHDEKLGWVELPDEIPIVVDYGLLPFKGNAGEVYFVEILDKLAVWNDTKQDWALISKTVTRLLYSEDQYNNRRGAIMDQRARKVNK